ncbi:MAG TPA: class I SAM-dependent methyltransferase [Candidatus Limnocylindria bacterium]|nr:class I SAM-dependent methyltransferase [Candidatus Limnocylindria bacterium]
MTFRPSFNCLWCGRPHQTRSEQDIEGYAVLCSECVGRAQDNDFLRYRLRQGLHARAQASRPPDVDAAYRAYYAAAVDGYDDWYLGRGEYSRSAIDSVAFAAELDAATLWLDHLPLAGEIVELAAGTGWWSPLLAQKGELWLYDAVPEMLEPARERLLAHSLAAHIHVRDAWQRADRQVDALFTGFWLPHVPSGRLIEFFDIVSGWLKPGATYAFIEEPTGDRHGSAGTTELVRLEAGGRQFALPEAHHPPAALDNALREAGFTKVDIVTTGRFFVLGQAQASSE